MTTTSAMLELCEPNADITSLADRYRHVRQTTLELCAPLKTEDYGLQTALFASPPRWHLGHTTWFFETFILREFVADYQPVHPLYHTLFNSYYQGIGDPFPRAMRGALSRPTNAEVRAYRDQVDHSLLKFLTSLSEHGDAITKAVRQRLVLGLQHEQQHQELLLSDLLYHFAQNPLCPAYLESPVPAAGKAGALSWHAYQGGLIEMGHEHSNGCFAFDNESPRHPVFLAPYRLARRLISNAEFLQFIDDGGYQQAKLWLADGWQWRQQQAIDAPLYWRRDETGGWQEFTLYGLHSLKLDAAVAHISYYEADAFARWAGKRLPTEAEWEHATAQSTMSVPTEALQAQCKVDADFFGQLWQWTSSAYSPYPGFQPASGAVGEYNGKFMCNQMVLRGSACITPYAHARLSYRNFFYPSDRWTFTGIRLADNG